MKKFLILILFWWAMIFPQLSLNTFTSEITLPGTSYNDLNDPQTCLYILENAEFDFRI